MKFSAAHIIPSLFLLIIAAGIGIVITLQDRSESVRNCGKVEISIEEPWHFVSENDIAGCIRKECGECTGKRLDSLDLAAIEAAVDNESAVLKSQVWCTPEGILHVNVTQRKPIVRFQKGGNGFYADSTGCIFPLQKGHTAQVPIIDGCLPVNISAGYKGEAATEQERRWVSLALEMAGCIRESGVWSENITQICVQPNGDIIIIPREGEERFIFGSPENAADKLLRMERYYTHISPSKEKGYYHTVNVKYNGQIICRQ